MRVGARIEPDFARRLLAGGALLVDVRRTDDAELSRPGALRISPDEIPQHLHRLPRGSSVLLTCT